MANVLNGFAQPGTDGDNVLTINGTLITGSDSSITQNGVVIDRGFTVTNTRTYTLVGTATLAQINAGTTILAGVTNRIITPVFYQLKINGAFTTATSIDLTDTNGTPVNITSLAIAGATNGALILPTTANITNGAGYLAPLTTGAGLKIGKTGSTAAGGTSVLYTIQYIIT